MSEARRLLERWSEWWDTGIGEGQPIVDDTRAYLAQPSREGELVAALRAELVELVDGRDSTLAEQIRDLILNLDDGTLEDDIKAGAALAQGKKA